MNELPSLEAMILDLDGVVTRTAKIHARAWKRMFDEYLEQNAASPAGRYDPFDIERDYLEYVDGKPRYDGVESFLQSRGIRLERGTPQDPPGKNTVCGLGNLKNEYFHEILKAKGPEVFPDAVEQIRVWRRRGIRTAVVSSSKNCETILEAAGLAELFDARMDGVESERLGLSGKPAPDIFLEAARRLGVTPSRAGVVEDSVAGVQAGRAGGFGRVIGVDRKGKEETLRTNGAETVVRDLRELDKLGIASEKPSPGSVPASATEHLQEILLRLKRRRAAIFLDYDGTLTPIVARPEWAVLSEEMRNGLKDLAGKCPVAIVSGRDRKDVERLVGLDRLYYAGSHGFDIAGPGELHIQNEAGKQCLPDLDAAEEKLQERLGALPGILVERKRFALAVHYRNVDESQVPEIEETVDAVRNEHPRLRKRGGKKVFELQPDVDWNKGRAVLWLLDALDLDRPDVLPFYIGDDLTDEDAFRALSGRGIGIGVGDLPENTFAQYRLEDPESVRHFLSLLSGRLHAPGG